MNCVKDDALTREGQPDDPDLPVQVGDDRDQTADDRDRRAEAHDQVSDARDERADARDERAEARDERAEARDEAADGVDIGAAGDRAGALRDRQGGASDRTQAADDRGAAATDRVLSARERVISSIDASEIEHANEELRAADALKNEMLAMTSHDLRVPLTAIIGLASTLADSWEALQREEKIEFVDRIADRSRRMISMVEQLQIACRIEAGVLEVRPIAVSLQDAIEEAVAEVVRGGNEISVSVPSETIVLADRQLLHRILVNYLGNAIKHGTPPITVDAEASDGLGRAHVRDRGAGVPEEFRVTMFEPFSRAPDSWDQRGSGLGLSIAKTLAEAQGGRVWYETNVPNGACFGLELPLHDSAEKTALT